MKIALINENSQAAKNGVIVETLKKVVEPLGHEVFNYGMYRDEWQNYKATITNIFEGVIDDE